MYQSLYRKYRPKTFDEVVGQQTIVKTLKNAIKANRLSHAYLFCGPRGTGKTSIAKILAKTINCEKLDNYNPCNDCVSCTQINNKQTIDIIEIDAASNNGVDEIRELKSKINLIPSVSKYKVYIVDEVHMLTTGAFNALLKTLEEPPSHTIFILATTEPHKIPLTILSRCQRFDFTRISDKEIANRLKHVVEKENITIETEAIEEISRLSDGGMRDALSLLDQVSAYALEKITITDVHDVNGTVTSKEIKKIIENIIDDNMTDIFKMIEQYDDDGKNLVKLTEEIVNYLKNCLFYYISPDYFNELNLNNEYYIDLCKKTNIDKIVFLIEIFAKTMQEMKNFADPKLQLELTFVKFYNGQNISREIKKEKINIIKDKPKIKIDVKIEDTKSKKNIDNKLKEQLIELKHIRINNTLARFNKKMLLDFKKSLEDINTYILNEKYSIYASLILDGVLKATSDTNLIFVYDNEEQSDFFNENLIKVEELIEYAFNKHYKLISTSALEWNEIKNNFNSKKISYEYFDEPADALKIFDKEQNQVEQLFENIVEYQ